MSQLRSVEATSPLGKNGLLEKLKRRRVVCGEGENAQFGGGGGVGVNSIEVHIQEGAVLRYQLGKDSPRGKREEFFGGGDLR